MGTEYIESIRNLPKDFDNIELSEGRGDPEAPPHRKDDPAVISAMRGNKAMIVVEPDTCNAVKDAR